MPCDSSQGMGDHTDYESRRDIIAMKKELDRVTAMLCWSLSMISAMNMGGLPTDVREWYEEHQKWDKSQGR